MAFMNHRNNFKGSLHNISCKDLYRLDYDLFTLEERKKYIQQKYEENDKFYNAYIYCKEKSDMYLNEEVLDKYDLLILYKYNLNSSDFLSDNINIFRYIERDATFLLNSKDIPRRKQMKYVILDERDFKKITYKETSIEDLTENSNLEEEEIMYFLDNKNKNVYSNLEQKIHKCDLKDADLEPVLAEYQKIKDKLKYEMELIKSGQKASLSLNTIRNNLKSINDDMLLAKTQLKGVRCRAKKLGDESGCFNLDSIDYKNAEHIAAIIKNISFFELTPNSDLSILGTDVYICLKKLLKTRKITQEDFELIMLKNKGLANTKIAKQINRDEKVVRRRLNRIIGEIVNKM